MLSGFLIGNILLELREANQLSLATRLQRFYVRRALRIFPLYYFLLLGILTLGLLGITRPRWEAWPFHALYLTNLYLFCSGADIDSQTHLWSLAVEEHFYLLAPVVLLWASFGRMALIFAAIIAALPVLRASNVLLWGMPRFEYLSFMQFDVLLLGIGGAILLRRQAFLGVDARGLRRLGIGCGTVALVTLAWGYFPSEAERIWEAAALPSALGVATTALIAEIWRGNRSAAARLLAWGPFAFLGSISYGLYVYHNFFFVLARHSSGVQYALRVALPPRDDHDCGAVVAGVGKALPAPQDSLRICGSGSRASEGTATAE